MPEKRRVLFVCLGNICRSTIAEAVFQHICKQRGIEDLWEADSCATGSWHTGSSPDRRTLKTLANHDITFSHRARQLTNEDFEKFDFIFGMDNNNINAIKAAAPSTENHAVIELLGKYDPKGHRIIRDPYYDSGSAGFEEVFEQCKRSCLAFLEQHK
ncbi:low molecular weight phosphotyrosine protein phosphatase [Galendromus occidentalis]|uniref:Low molecular weight phosphotyrosine protein phosphatase n=1 Tax=Galendromus occidentalis TaxID=34638 RepID=A0AAJ6VV66_9ACAR|nr:low molecular weight phosphotyrosine protein phosphatase [Galendromus occidentalis]